jgi:hypothetical protein
MYKTKICLEKEPNFFPLFGTKRHYQLKNILNVLELDFMVHCVSQFLAKYDVNLFFFQNNIGFVIALHLESKKKKSSGKYYF